MTISKRIDKLTFINKGVISSYFVADQYWQMLAPLLKDRNIYSRWDNSVGVDGVKVIRMSLYANIITDLYAILFDRDKQSGSLKNVILGFEDSHLIKEIEKRFCQPCETILVTEHTEEERKYLDERLKEDDVRKLKVRFHELLSEVIEGYKNLENSELASRVKVARSKIYAHKEIGTVNGERQYFNGDSIGLRYDDAGDMLKDAQDIIFNSYLLLTNASYALDSFMGHHVKVAQEYWER